MPRFTDEQKQYFNDHFENGDIKELAQKLNRTIQALYRRGNKMGLKRDLSARTYNGEWPDEEKELLKKLFPFTDNEIIAERLGKTVSSIRNKATKLKLKKANNFWKISKEKYVMENYGKIPIAEMIKHLKKTRWAIINKYRELSGLRKTGDKVIISKVKNKAR